MTEKKDGLELEKKESNKNQIFIAVVRIRGGINTGLKAKETMDYLSLFNRNYCSVHKNSPSLQGMLKACKDYVTWGEISEEVLKDLISKRSEKNPKDETKTKKFFRLNSPLKGYGRKGMKLPFIKGGALGYRGEKINDLIKRML